MGAKAAFVPVARTRPAHAAAATLTAVLAVDTATEVA
jgi:hypothetical protein